MKVLVTGGAGFIGSHVVDAYLAAGHDVAVVDDLSSGSLVNLSKKASFYLMDIGSPQLEKVFAIEKPDVVNHHAAQISVPVSAREPMLDARINGLGLLNVLEASRVAGVKKFIFISSGGAIYGEAGGQKGNAAKVSKVEDLAGQKVGASKGTIAATIGDQVNKQLAAEGLKPMQLSLFSGDAAGMLAVNSGQSFAHIMDLPFAAYEAAQTGAGDKYAVVLPNLLGAIPYGISVNKDNMALAQAIQAALNQMIADGSYQQILDKWGLGAGAVKQATINGGTTSAGG